MLPLLLFLSQAPPAAEDLMAEVERRNLAPAFRYEGEVTVEKPGEPLERKRWRYQRTGPPGQSRVLLRFLAPAEIRGVALLVWNEPTAPAAIWLYTPALGRSRRIAPQDRRGRIAGTDLLFEDLEDRPRTHWTYGDLSEANDAGEPCWRVRARLRSGAAPGEFSWIWISREKWAPVRVEKWRGGKLLRVSEFSGFKKVGAFWTPFRTTITERETGSRTTVRLATADYPERLPKADFTLEGLRGEW